MTGARDVESRVEEFVELEEELTGSETGASGTYDRGHVADAATLPAANVPEAYPVTIETEQALRLDVDAGGETVPVYLEWPGEGEQSDHVGRLLDALGREPDEFANIYGDEVALTEQDGWHGIDVEGTAAVGGVATTTGDADLRRGRQLLLGGVAASVLGAATAGLGGALGSFGTVLQVVAMVGLPVAIYRDVERLEERVGRDRADGLWVLGAFVPVANAVVGSLYVVDRTVQLRGIEGSVPSSTWRTAVVAGIALPWIALLLVAVNAGLAAVAFVGAALVLPVAVHFDAAYVEAATGEDQDAGLWTVGALVGTLLLVGWLVGIVYLVRRQSMAG